MFWSVGWPLLRAEDFFYNLDTLYGGLGIGKLQFLIKKGKKKFSVVIFFQFKPWIRIGFGSGSVLVSNIKLWIRIRIRKKINTDPQHWFYHKTKILGLNIVCLCGQYGSGTWDQLGWSRQHWAAWECCSPGTQSGVEGH